LRRTERKIEAKEVGTEERSFKEKELE